MVNPSTMFGGTQRADSWSDEDDAALEEVRVDDIGNFEEPTTPPDWTMRLVSAACLLAAIGWLWLFVTAQPLPTSAPALARAVTDLVPPLALIALVWLLVARGSRRELGRLGEVSRQLRGEHHRLEATMASLGSRLAADREAVVSQTDALVAIGDGAAERLREIGGILGERVTALNRQAEGLRTAVGDARQDMASLIDDLPRAHEATRELVGAIEAAGLSAFERAGALDAQLAALTARGREAEDVTGGAAQKLAAHLARVEGLSTAAEARLVGASDTMTHAIDGALDRASVASDAARRAMDAQGAAMLALVEQSEAALTRTGDEAAKAVAARVAAVTERIETLGALLHRYGEDSAAIVDDVGVGIDRIDARFEAIDGEATARNDRLGTALGALGDHATTLSHALDQSGGTAQTLIARAETLLTALDAVTREVDEALPAAFERLDAKGDASRERLTVVGPEVARLEREAGSALDRLIEAEGVLSNQRQALATLGDETDARIAASRDAAEAFIRVVTDADTTARAIATGAGAELVDAMVRVRETAQTAAERARTAIGEVIPASAAQLAAATQAALTDAVSAQVEVQIAELAATAERAVAAANAASDRLMRQMLTIADTSAQIETRIAEAHAEVEHADRDNFARRVALLIESLNSTSIDVTKILSNDVTDSAWAAYLRGDRGVFTRRAVRLLDQGEVREIARHYADDPAFREQLNRYVHDFEAMLRNVLATRDGSPLGVALLSSDMGKLYVALAQAIERLR